MNLPLALTCGDPSGVGPEVIARWLREHPEQRAQVCPIGPKRWLETLETPLFCAVGDADFEAVPGKPTAQGARAAFDALEAAARGCKEGRFAAVVTGPVSKREMAQVEFHFPGQTEFFADRWGGEPTMAFAGGKLAVVLATWHIPLRVVPQALSFHAIENAVRQADFLARALGHPAPRIAVCGLNPHAGENGLLGDEEADIVDPALDELRKEFFGLSRALPPDTVFWRQLQGEFDVSVALYHDQGLGPLKAVDFDASANLTLGLPFVRTSPDHGTAFGIAGKGIASCASFDAAVRMARALVAARP